MKLKLLLISISVIIGLILVLIGTFYTAIIWQPWLKVPAGKDTVAIFGDGTYQILWSWNGNNKIKSLVSFDRSQEVIVKEVNAFYEVKNNKTTYVIGDNSYVIVKYKDKTVQKVQDLNVLSNNDRKVFEGMK